MVKAVAAILLSAVAATLLGLQAIKLLKIAGCTGGIMAVLEETYGPAPSQAIRDGVEKQMNFFCRQLSAQRKL